SPVHELPVLENQKNFSMDHFSKSDKGGYDFVIHMHSAATPDYHPPLSFQNHPFQPDQRLLLSHIESQGQMFSSISYPSPPTSKHMKKRDSHVDKTSSVFYHIVP